MQVLGPGNKAECRLKAGPAQVISLTWVSPALSLLLLLVNPDRRLDSFHHLTLQTLLLDI